MPYLHERALRWEMQGSQFFPEKNFPKILWHRPS
nr:MAG TPA: hypothetical protein [Caudoviricetes sp.]